MRRLLTSILFALPLAAAYSYFVTADFTTGIPSSGWTSNGTLTGSTPNGLVSTASNGGSVIYGGSGLTYADQYEMKATLKITASGGTFVLYTRATSNALTSLTPTGTMYAMEMTPTLSGGGCTMAVNHYRIVSGSATLIAAHSLACADGMTVRLAQRNGYYMGVTSLNEMYFIGDGTITTGNAGFGAKSLPSGNGILKGEIGQSDQTAPTTFSPTNVRTSVFD